MPELILTHPTSGGDAAVCGRCRRPLRNATSRLRGYGPDCWARLVGRDADDGEGWPERLAAIRDVHLWRDGQGYAHADVPYLIHRHSESFEFGYSGAGPADLALNILALFTPREFAEANYQDFKRTFIATLPHECGVIPAAAIRSWIAVRRGEQTVLPLAEVA